MSVKKWFATLCLITQALIAMEKMEIGLRLVLFLYGIFIEVLIYIIYLASYTSFYEYLITRPARMHANIKLREKNKIPLLEGIFEENDTEKKYNVITCAIIYKKEQEKLLAAALSSATGPAECFIWSINEPHKPQNRFFINPANSLYADPTNNRMIVRRANNHQMYDIYDCQSRQYLFSLHHPFVQGQPISIECSSNMYDTVSIDMEKDLINRKVWDLNGTLRTSTIKPHNYIYSFNEGQVNHYKSKKLTAHWQQGHRNLILMHTPKDAVATPIEMTIHNPDPIVNCRIKQKAQLLALAGDQGTINLYDTTTGRKITGSDDFKTNPNETTINISLRIKSALLLAVTKSKIYLWSFSPNSITKPKNLACTLPQTPLHALIVEKIFEQQCLSPDEEAITADCPALSALRLPLFHPLLLRSIPQAE